MFLRGGWHSRRLCASCQVFESAAEDPSQFATSLFTAAMIKGCAAMQCIQNVFFEASAECAQAEDGRTTTEAEPGLAGGYQEPPQGFKGTQKERADLVLVLIPMDKFSDRSYHPCRRLGVHRAFGGRETVRSAAPKASCGRRLKSHEALGGDPSTVQPQAGSYLRSASLRPSASIWQTFAWKSSSRRGTRRRPAPVRASS